MPNLEPDAAAVALFGLLCGPNAGVDRAFVPDQDLWHPIVAAARRHGLAPLLFWRLTERRAGAALPGLPTAARTSLRNAYLQTLAANLTIRHRLAAVTSALVARGVSPVLLKGAHLAFGVYADPGVRPMCDLDLLVAREAVPAAVEALTELGYAPWRSYDLQSELELLHHLPVFEQPGWPFVEIHWALLRPEEPYRIDTAGLLARSRPSGIPGVPARVLDPADLLLHLCLHGAAADRLAGGLKTLVDAVEVLGTRRDDPALLEASGRAAAWGAGRCLSLVLSLCDDLAPGALPPDLRHALNPDPVAAEPLAMARALVVAPPGEMRQISPNLARAVGASSGEALRGILRGFFPSRTFLATMYGHSPRSAGIWGCYPRRWVDLLRRYGVPALKAIGGERGAARQAARLRNENALADWLAGGR